jgi:hypothetical protein
MSTTKRFRQNGITLVVTLGFGLALIVLVGFPPVGEALEFWSGGPPTASSAVATVISILWLAVGLVLVYTFISTARSVVNRRDIIKRAHRWDLLLGAAGMAICLLAALMAHAGMVHPGSVHTVLSLVRHH